MGNFDKDKLKAFSIKALIERETGKAFILKGTTYFINCPLHDDPGPSLSIDEKTNEWYCHGACGTGGDTIKFIQDFRNIDFQDACKYLVEHYVTDGYDSEGEKPKGNSTRGRKPLPQMPVPEGAINNAVNKALKSAWWLEHFGEFTGYWRYHDINGGISYLDVRFEKRDGPKISKQVLPLYYARTGKWKTGIPFDILNKKRALYNLHMLANNKSKPVLIVEGCKCASVEFPGLRDNFILTTWPGGVNGIHKVDLRPLFERRVVIWPDNDKPDKKWKRAGYQACFYLAEMLEGKSDVQVLKTADHPKGGTTGKGYDIYDYVEDGGNPLTYINDPDNHLTIDEVKKLAGLVEPEAAPAPNFAEVRKFTDLSKEPHSETLLYMQDNLNRNKSQTITKEDGNFILIAENDPAFNYLLAYDRATNDIKYSDKYTELDELDNKIWKYIQRYYSIAPTKVQRTDIIKMIAYKNSFNSLEVFFDELKEELFGNNEVSFAANPLHELLGFIRFSLEEDYTDHDNVRALYVELFDKYFMRMFIKIEYIIKGDLDNIPPADIVPILEGDQGLGKTRLCLLLSLNPQKYYVDMAELQLTTSRDTLAKIRGKLIGELGELAGLKRTELESIKAFISSTFDEMRRLYSENTVRSPRTVSFIGTTNEREYLRDTTGNRRFWPVRLEYVDHNIFNERKLIKQLYVYYMEKARKAIKEDTVYSDLLVSDNLTEFVNYLREEKRVMPIFMDNIMKYIHEMEDAVLMLNEPIEINILQAASKMFDLPEEKVIKLPPRFESEFSRMLQRRGYKRARKKIKGIQRRYWILDGRYCDSCKNLSKSVIRVEVEGVSEILCDDCLSKPGITEKVDDPF